MAMIENAAITILVAILIALFIYAFFQVSEYAFLGTIFGFFVVFISLFYIAFFSVFVGVMLYNFAAIKFSSWLLIAIVILLFLLAFWEYSKLISEFLDIER